MLRSLRTFSSSCRNAAEQPKKLNKYSNIVTEPKSQGASQVSLFYCYFRFLYFIH